MGLTKQQEHDLIVAEAQALHERLEALLDHTIDVIVIAHSPDSGEGCTSSASLHVNTTRDQKNGLIAHMLDEAITMMLPQKPADTVAPKRHTH